MKNEYNPKTNRNYIRKVLIVAAISFTVASALGALVFALIRPDGPFWLVGPIFGGLFALFACSNVERELKLGQFEINANNKDPKIGLEEYYQTILNSLISLRYEETERSENYVRYSPVRRSKLMGGDVVIERSPYYLSLQGPRGTLKILASELDLEKIFL